MVGRRRGAGDARAGARAEDRHELEALVAGVRVEPGGLDCVEHEGERGVGAEERRDGGALARAESGGRCQRQRRRMLRRGRHVHGGEKPSGWSECRGGGVGAHCARGRARRSKGRCERAWIMAFSDSTL